MRIAFLGKGGAGKTTTAASFVEYACKRHEFVLAVDADVNVHLAGSLRFHEKPREIGEEFDKIAEKLQGARTDLKGRPMIGSTPPSLKSSFIRPSASDQFISEYALHRGNIALLTVGPYAKSDVGGNCYHSKLGSYTLMLHHLLDTDSDIVIADTTAGTDNVATSLNLAYDLNVFVVEPTKKSVSVYLDFIKLVPHLEDRVYVLANKVDGDEDIDFIKKHVSAERLIGSVPFSQNMKRFEQGDEDAIKDFHKEQDAVFDKVYELLCSKKRDWNQYLQLLNQAHEKVSVDWYNDYYQSNIGTDYDPDFSYEKVIAAHAGRQPVGASA